MKIKFLGTAAAEGVPGIFCDCEVCKKSRLYGGKNIRTRSQAIVDDRILIDFPADTYMHSLLYNIELSKIKTCIITHNHMDHLHPAELWCRSAGIAYLDNTEPLTFYAAKSGYMDIVNEVINHGLDDSKRIAAEKIYPFVPFEAEGYKITPLKANHDPNSDPVIYIVQKDGKNLLYAHDTGFFPDETAKYLKDSGIKFDLVSFDCCGAVIPDENYSIYAHMNLVGVKITRDMLIKNGNIDNNTVCVLNHFSHNGVLLHDEMEETAKKDGFEVSYDGMEIKF